MPPRAHKTEVNRTIAGPRLVLVERALAARAELRVVADSFRSHKLPDGTDMDFFIYPEVIKERYGAALEAIERLIGSIATAPILAPSGSDEE